MYRLLTVQVRKMQSRCTLRRRQSVPRLRRSCGYHVNRMPSFRVVGACGPHAVKATLQALAMLAAMPALPRSLPLGWLVCMRKSEPRKVKHERRPLAVPKTPSQPQYRDRSAAKVDFSDPNPVEGDNGAPVIWPVRTDKQSVIFLSVWAPPPEIFHNGRSAQCFRATKPMSVVG